MKTNADSSSTEPLIEIWTEGKTDWQILKRAFHALNLTLNVAFNENEASLGDKVLLGLCEAYSKKANNPPIIFIFDRDNTEIVKNVEDTQNPFKSWGNSVYSFAIPVPEHRQRHENISIEMYFTDKEIQTYDDQGRRLFLTSEFNEVSGKFKQDSKISIGNKGRLRGITTPTRSKIVDSEVYDEYSKNIALSKADFAQNIWREIGQFALFDFNHFKQITDVIQLIIEISRPRANICYPHLESWFEVVQKQDKVHQLYSVLQLMKNIITMTMQIFTAITIGFYENEITKEPDEYRRKVKPIKKILSEGYKAPSPSRIYELAERCYYLIDSKAPEFLVELKLQLDEVFILDAVGQMLDDLDILFPPRRGKVKLLNKAKIRRALFQFVFPEIFRFSDISEEMLLKAVTDYQNKDNISAQKWFDSLKIMSEILQPFHSRSFLLKTVEKVDPSTGEYIVNIKIYKESVIEYSKLIISSDELEDYQGTISEIEVGSNTFIHLYPFALIKDDSLYFYQRTLGSGYEYYSISAGKIYIRETRRKFNHSVFKIGSTQELFWTDVLPVRNEVNGVKANIPDDGILNFVGREAQLSVIQEQIIEIPNQYGIVFGPGGIGKTSLMQQLSRKLFKESDVSKVLFDNVIWVSAKSDYYDHIFNTVETRDPQFRSLDNIIVAVLQFFEFANLDEYAAEDRQELLLEQLEHSEQRTLLILDNFETISPGEADKIIRFFSLEVKRQLRRKPDAFKLIITSRKQFPGGFHPIELQGLDKGESIQLMHSLAERYKATSHQITEPQMIQLYEASKGIPIVIKHSFGRVFEYHEPLDSVVRALSSYGNEVVQFSFKEIFDQVEKQDKSGLQLSILILLELVNYPLMLRQVADILGCTEIEVEKVVPSLVNFQCLKKLYQENSEKYIVNDEIRLLSRSLAQKHSLLANDIRNKITINFTVDKQMDFTSEELNLISIFEKYIQENDLLEAEDFIKSQLKEHPHSIVLNFYYARFLKDKKREIDAAIQRLEQIREPSGNHSSILRELSKYYIALDIPNFDKASIYIIELERSMGNDAAFILEIADFYVKWSTSIKLKSEINALDEKVRVRKYKDLADKAIELINRVSERTHQTYYLLAQSYFNKWNYDVALEMIDRAIGITRENPRESSASYNRFRKLVLEKQEFYSHRR